ncbi:MAG: GTPase [Candidatus Micrarchaeaceae archaeon]
MAENQALKGRLTELEEEYAKTKYNKATNKYLGMLRAKMAKIRKQMAAKKSFGGTGFAIRKAGDATVALVGFPNAGKSSLLKTLTSVESKVAGYAFTTVEVIPGMLEFNGAKIQLLDLPGLIPGAHEGKGEGTKIASVIRTSDLLLFLVDINRPGELYELIKELNMLGIRPNKPAPGIRIERKNSGGVSVAANRHRIPEKDLITGILNEFDIYNCDIYFYDDATADDIVDALSGNSAYIKGIVALNKIDTVDPSVLQKTKNEIESNTGMDVIPISAMRDINTISLKEALFRKLGLLRIYLKPKDGEPDFSKPLIAKQGDSVMDVAKAIHSRAAKNLRYAYVDGKSVKFKNQRVGPEHALADGDIVTLVYTKA